MPLDRETSGHRTPTGGCSTTQDDCPPIPNLDPFLIHEVLGDVRTFQPLVIPDEHVSAVDNGKYLLFNNWITGRMDLDMVEVDLDLADALLSATGISAAEMVGHNPTYLDEHDPEVSVTLALTRYWSNSIRQAISTASRVVDHPSAA